jgi:hypothetical protein
MFPVGSNEIVNTHQLLGLAQGDANLEEEAQKLNALQAFERAQTPENYYSMPIAARYLVAGRYTYPVTRLWYINTKAMLMEKLEKEFQTGVDIYRMNQAVQEAIALQEKLLFGKILLKTLERRENIDGLASLKPRIFDEIKHCLWKGYGSPMDRGLDFGGDVLRANSNNSKITDVIGRVLFVWDSAISDLRPYDFGGARV